MGARQRTRGGGLALRRVLVAWLAIGPRVALAQSAAGEPPRPELQADKLSKLPRQVRFVEADYPAEAAARGLETDVTLLLDIDAQGKVTQVAISEPSAYPDLGFEEAALVAAHQFEFEPAELDGKPIAVQLAYRYRFVLRPAAPPAGPEAPAATPAEAPAPAVPPTPARPPVVNLSGLLVERGTRLPMPGVTVTVFRETDDGRTVGYEATSDPTGRFEFFDLDPGAWKVLVEQPGYFPFRTTEEIAPGLATEVKYYVERGAYNPYDVTVTATRPRKEVNRTVISAAEIDKIPGTAGDPLAVVQNFPGVARVPAGSGQIIVRGSAPEDSRVFVDGIEVPNIYHFGGLRSVIPIGMLDGIDFYPGNFGPEYGRATGGIIDVKTKKALPKKPGGYADVSLLDTSLYLEVPLGDKGSLAVAGRRSYVDFIIQAAVPDGAAVNVIAAPRYYDYQALATYRPAAAHELRVFWFGSDDKLALLFESPGQADFNLTSGRLNAGTSFQRLLLSHRYVPGTGLTNHLRLSTGNDSFNFSLGNLGFKLDLYQAQVRDNVEYQVRDWLILSAGVDFLFQRSRGAIRLPPPSKEGQPNLPQNTDFGDVRSAVFDQDFWSPSVFAEAELRPVEGLRVFPGVRFDYFSRISQALISPRITARYQLHPLFLVKGGAGLFQQEPFFDETDRNFGNPDLKAEKALHYSVGGEYRPRQHLSFDATAFYKDLWSQVSPTARPQNYDNRGTGRVYGLELVARHELFENFTGWLAYTLSRAERTDSGASESRKFDFDQPHILTLIASYLLPRNWQVGSRFRLVSGNPITPIRSSVYNASADEYIAVFGATNSARNGAFHQLDLRVDKRWIYDGWILNAYLDIQNVYNRANPEGRTYNYDFTRFRPQQGLPIFPILGLRGEF
ncbi:MAG: TonB-dependent receptor [Armatimonadota bacterium]|nr:TonB-dependent receptor [Armatimonadota bacterium]